MLMRPSSLDVLNEGVFISYIETNVVALAQIFQLHKSGDLKAFLWSEVDSALGIRRVVNACAGVAGAMQSGYGCGGCHLAGCMR